MSIELQVDPKMFDLFTLSVGREGKKLCDILESLNKKPSRKSATNELQGVLNRTARECPKFADMTDGGIVTFGQRKCLGSQVQRFANKVVSIAAEGGVSDLYEFLLNCARERSFIVPRAPTATATTSTEGISSRCSPT